MPHKTCIVIVGATATGKTNLSLQLAEYLHTDIISADSRQCYKELTIGVAKPGAADQQRTRHYFINSHSIHEEVNAGTFESYALKAANEIFEIHDTAVMVGGTGLYVKAFCSGMDDMPGVNKSIRADLRMRYQVQGLSWLGEMIREHDPLFYSRGEMQNPQRMMRALEVKLSSGKSILEMHSAPQKLRNFSIVKIGTELERAVIYQNINKRVDQMMAQGLLEEAKSVFPFRHLNALQTVGYTELFDYIKGDTTLEQSVEHIKKNTRHYAKRQLTWFKRDEAIHWFHPFDLNAIIEFVNEAIVNRKTG